ncbi:glycine-rich domain-containing protein [Magnetofaba australis]|uniref:Uncharacterized protein n=1 Tax=Magnetofaba australis IT-1 TaxID=1434232 RepID=A0A1Y2K2G2_9PROT|nr:hypothetical protein [Magnetofaba australis]OSM02162.1 hypothetical protein MAIT1_02262 [Magnetofaba australis IT-1]
MSFSTLLSLLIGALVFWQFLTWRKRASLQEDLEFIQKYKFTPVLKQKLATVYPHLDEQQQEQVITGLRDFFCLCRMSKKRAMVFMPSQAVDVAWHEFILFTRTYADFCKRGFGYFLHHTPTEAMRSPDQAQDGIKRAWRLACLKEGIDSKKPDRLPLLFALDGELGIADGFVYTLDCRQDETPNRYCATHIGCGGSIGCASSWGCSGDGGGAGCGGDAGGTGASCGGSSCGGAGCGGGS